MVPTTSFDLGEEYKDTVKDRLLKNIEINENDCWIWKRSKNSGKQNHGRIAIMNQGKRIHALTHRISYFIWKGKIPKGLYVLHKCNNSSCCNPEHLYLGDAKQNSKDMFCCHENVRDYMKGERNLKSKLKEKDILEIRKLRKEGWSIKKLSEKFFVTQPSISAIINNLTWKNVCQSNFSI